ncbi:MAG: VOC family protein [Gemmatirosa sp.]
MPLTVSASPAAPPLTLGRIVVLVRDYDAALAFYQAAFGARVLFDAPSPTGARYLHVTLASEGTREPAVGFWLLRAEDADDAHVGRQTGGQPLAVLYTSDVQAAVARVLTAAGTLVRPVQSADGTSFAHVADLYGNEFVLVELPAPASQRGVAADVGAVDCLDSASASLGPEAAELGR